jgi:hypothetical protein
LTAALVLDLAFGLDEPERPTLRPEADAEGLPALADSEAEADEEDLVGFVEPDLPLAFADDDDALGAGLFLEDGPPAADERTAAFFFVVGMSVSVAESVDERWGWNR